MGWTLSDSCPTSDGAVTAKAPANAGKGKKRSVDGDAEDDNAAPEKPTKKAKTQKKPAAVENEDGDDNVVKPVKKPAKGRGRPKKAAKIQEVDEDDGPTNDLGGPIKEEDDGDEI